MTSRVLSSGITAAASSGRSWIKSAARAAKHVHLCSANNKPEVLEKPTDLVLKISLDLDEQGSADEKGLDRVAVEVFDAHLLVPSALHDPGDAHGVVAVALVDLQLQSSLGMPRIDADDRQSQLLQLGPQPRRGSSCLEPRAPCVKTKSGLVVMPSGRQIFAFFLLSA